MVAVATINAVMSVLIMSAWSGGLSGVATGAGAISGASPGPDNDAQTSRQRMGSSNQTGSAVYFAEPAIG
jgi:hypothetical protein